MSDNDLTKTCIKNTKVLSKTRFKKFEFPLKVEFLEHSESIIGVFWAFNGQYRQLFRAFKAGNIEVFESICIER
jgi:hypothetical protein